MERQRNQLWAIALTGLVLAPTAVAGNIWDDLFKKLNKKNALELQATLETTPAYKLTPKLTGFRGIVEVPTTLTLTNGTGKVHSSAGQLVFDGSITCNYSPRLSGWIVGNIFYLTGCSDGSRAGDDIRIDSKVELKLTQSASEKATLLAKVKVIQKDDISYGLVLPYLDAEEGQVLTFNGEAWVADYPDATGGTPGPQGPQGPQGEQGPMGPMGPQGPAGANGAAGAVGPAGAQGQMGPMGPQGPAGPAGATGAAGAPGAAGAAGPKGDNGAVGAAGPMGPQGPAGAAGAAGATGAVGPQGPQGPKGDNGAVGATGPAGAAGAAGAVGPQGPQGPKGDNGAVGATGPAGAAGAAGAVGPQGPQGPAGADGAPGVAGAPGAVGPAGAMGPQGPQGPKGDAGANGSVGPMGPMGPMGPAGATGATGAAGADGAPGAAGPQGPQGVKGDKGDQGLSQIAYLRDERTSGTHGGDCTAGVWNTRQLNVIGGDTGFISLSGNQFTLQPGKYFIEAEAPAFATGAHQAKIKVISTGADALIGSNSVSSTTSTSATTSNIVGEIVVSAASTFELQHRCTTTKTVSGFGAGVNFGTVEIYSQIKIIKKQ